ncbi:DUF927 domain-containing protein [Neisseriaceae bacterium B1]
MALLDHQTIETYTPSPRFETTEKGVFYIALDNDGNEKPPMQLSSCIDIIGSGIHTNGEAYRMIQYTHNVTREKRIAAIPCSAIGSNWSYLQGIGITIYSGRLKRERLADYLQTQGSREQWLITDKAGWINGAYVLPNGDIITPAEPLEPTGPNQTMRVFYNGDKSQAQAYQVSGSLKDWQENVARYAQHNSRLCLAIGTALAAPLLKLLKIESGGFHLQGKSSIGKTTAVNLSLSIFGEPENLLLSWKGTGLSFQNIAAARNDGFVVLDEIGQAAKKVVSDTAYSLFNGMNKLQAQKEGGNRALTRWRVLALSTGEKTPENYLRGMDDWNAGQNVRLPTLPADTGKGKGIYDTLHGFKDGGALSDHLNQQTAQYHGIAGRAFIAQLSPEKIQLARNHAAQFMAELPPQIKGQAYRVAKRFALIAAALEIATDITGFAAGQGKEAIQDCFYAWLAVNGSGDREEKLIIEAVENHFAQYAYTARYALKGAKHSYDHSNNHAGYYENDGETRFMYVLPIVIESEILPTHEKRQIRETLHGIQWLLKDKERFLHQLTGGIRYYKFKGVTPPNKEPQ